MFKEKFSVGRILKIFFTALVLWTIIFKLNF
jgi:hypothetical protein